MRRPTADRPLASPGSILHLAIGHRTRTSLRRLAAVAVLGACVAVLTRQVDLALLGRALASADYRLVALMTAAHLALFLGVKAWRWQLMLATLRWLPVRKLYAYVVAGCAVTNLFPARAGQAVRVALLLKDGVPVAGSVAVLVVEEICNAAVLGLLCLPLPFLLPLPLHVRVTLGVVAGGALVAILILGWLARAGRSSASGLLRRLADGLGVLREARAAGAVFALTVAMWLVDLGQIALAMNAVALPPSYAGAALVLLFVNLTNAVPVTPGQVGLFEAGAAAACVAVGATPEQGVAVGVLYHMMQFVPETALGLVVLGRGALGRGWRDAAAAAAPDRSRG
jgi:glycosyltransferase 2 family protein